MLEYTEYGGNFYGTPKSEIERIFSSDKIPLLILDLNGVETLKSVKRDFAVFAVYITGDREIIEQRLYDRLRASAFTEKAYAVYNKRKAQNLADEERVREMGEIFDLVLENRDISECAERIVSVFK